MIDTNFGVQSSTAIAKMLKKNMMLTCLHLDKGGSGLVLAQEIARALSHSFSLTSLSLQASHVRDKGATHLAGHPHFYENGIMDEGTVAICSVFKNSLSLAASGISIKWHKGIGDMEKGLGHYWQQLSLPPVAQLLNWSNRKVVLFCRHRQQEQQDRRLALAMTLQPRLRGRRGACCYSTTA